MEKPGLSHKLLLKLLVQFIYSLFADCNKFFNRPHRLKTHLLSHTGEKPFVCEVSGCNRAYARTEHLKRHVANSHKKSEDTLEGGTNESSLINSAKFLLSCSKCPKEFASQDSLKKHMKTRCASCLLFSLLLVRKGTFYFFSGNISFLTTYLNILEFRPHFWVSHLVLIDVFARLIVVKRGFTCFKKRNLAHYRRRIIKFVDEFSFALYSNETKKNALPAHLI